MSTAVRGRLFERLEKREFLSATTPTAAEQYMLELINRARSNPSGEAARYGIDLNEGLTPGTITADPKQPLAFNPVLIDAAREHTAWMVQNNTFAHDEGSVDPGAQMRAAGYAFNGSYGWGQNIAFRGQTPDYPPLNPTTALEHQDLFVDTSEPGRGHRLNILNGSFKEIGIGIQQAPFQGYNSVILSQDFAYQSGGSFLTGVVFDDSINHNHFYDPGEGLGGVTITATRDSDHAVFSTTTWSAGGYTLPLDPGAYTVTATGTDPSQVFASQAVTIGSQNVEADFIPSAATPSPSPTPTPTPNPTPTPPVPAGPPMGLLVGTLFRDLNANGTRDAGEKPLAQWRVFVDLNGDGKWERGEPRTTTNRLGQYHFTLPTGTYTVRIIPKAHFIPTTATTFSFQSNITAGTMQTALDFGAEQILPVHRARKI